MPMIRPGNALVHLRRATCTSSPLLLRASFATTSALSSTLLTESAMPESNSRRHPYRSGGSGKNFRRGRSGRPQTQAQNGDNAGPASGRRDFWSSPKAEEQAAAAASEVPAPTIDASEDSVSFADLAKDKLVHPTLIKTITDDLKFDQMTPVQAATIHQLLTHTDMLAQAKTGTGKTLAFLLPAIQNMIKRKTTPGRQISLLAIAPTRELAMQIAKDAQAVLKRMPQYKVRIAIGGTNKDREQREILQGCDILISTPGRLYDHLTTDGGDVVERLQELDTLVLDEADRLLDMGFLGSLKSIIQCLPDKTASNRQGMLFSATIDNNVQKFAHLVLSKDYKFISTIPEGEAGTHERVPQHLTIVPSFPDMAAALVGSMREEMAVTGPASFKCIVFAPAVGVVDFYQHVLSNIPGFPSVEAVHSRKSQNARTRITNEFRNATSGILVATDVIARGMDFPGVTNVFQAGLPLDRESYIHRLGRTARAGADGRGHFIVTKHEGFFPKHVLKDINFQNVPADLSAQDDVMRIAESFEGQSRGYQSWLGYYKAHMKSLGWDAVRLVQEANNYVLEGLGGHEIPTLPKSAVGKMGLKGTKGLVVGPDPPRHGRKRPDAAATGAA